VASRTGGSARHRAGPWPEDFDLADLRPAPPGQPTPGEPTAGEPAPGEPAPQWSARPLQVTAAIAGVGIAVFVALAVSGVLSEGASQAVDDLGQLSAGLTATLCCAWSWWRSRPPDRRWRLLLALGAGGWTTGQAIWSYYQVFADRELPSPSLADVGYFALPLLALPALWVYPARAVPPRPAGTARSAATGGPAPRPVFVLDSLVVVGSLFLLTWATSLNAAFEARGEAALVPFLVALGYPLTDLVLVVLVLLVGRFRLPLNPGALTLFGLGAVAISVSDSFFLYLVSTGAEAMPPLYNIGFLVGPVVIGLAALVPEPRPDAGSSPVYRRGTERAPALLPYLPLGATLLLVTGQVLTGSPIGGIEISVGLAVIALVVLRQFVTLLDNIRLLGQVRESEALLRAQAFYDSLTGLANRALFRERLEAALAPGSRRPVGLIFCDLDDFKLVNDGLGHAAGDELLREVAVRIRRCVHPADTVARLGGDEFAVLFEGTSMSPRAIGEAMLAGLLEPFVLQNASGSARTADADPVETGKHMTSARIGASIGVAVAEPGSGLRPERLMARADAAMYAAKRRGKNQAVMYVEGIEDDAAPEGALAGDLRRVLGGLANETTSAGTISVMYQPVVEFRTAQVVALEALVRWWHPRHGMIRPEHLLAVAEEAGLLGVLENRVLDIACRDIERLRRHAALRDLCVHVNVSAQRTTEPELAGVVQETLYRYALPGEALVVEITETSRVPDVDAAAAVLMRLRHLRVKLALDDFGAGFSGLTYLLQLPIDIVKLDRSLTIAVVGTRAAAIRNAAVNLVLELHLELIAEGVETPAQAGQLVGLGCELGQGFLYAKPGRLADLGLTRNLTW
jgi:diguanylate cyclase (GGDEF)-like protein